MQLYITPITRLSIFVLGVVFALSSCLKEIKEADQLDTNIFDRSYAGTQWWVITDYFEYINELGQTLVRVEFEIPEQNLPELKPSFIDLSVKQLDNADWDTLSVPLNSSGGYDYFTDFVKNDEDVYCLKLGIFLDDEDAIINEFQDCVSL